jgi:hypothetical protein
MRTLLTCAVLVLLVALGGCFTADVTLNADGSGTMDVTYDPMWPTSERRERQAFLGPGMTVKEITLGEMRDGAGGTTVPKSVTARVAFASVKELAQVERMSRFQIDVADAGEGTKRVTVAVKTKQAQQNIPAAGEATVRLRLPGDIVESSATVEGRTVVWKFPSADYFGKPGLKMTVTYKVPAGAGGVGAGAAGGGAPSEAGTKSAPDAPAAPAGGAAPAPAAPAAGAPAKNPS